MSELQEKREYYPDRSVKAEKEFTYTEYQRSSFNQHTHTIKRISSVQNGVKIDQVIKYDTKAPGFDTDGWLNKEEWRMILHDGKLVGYAEPSVYNAHFENGVPVGHYCMPLFDSKHEDTMNGRIPYSYLKSEYSRFKPSFPVPTGDSVIDNLPELPVFRGGEELMLDQNPISCNANLKAFLPKSIEDIEYIYPLIEGRFENGKFTGQAKDSDFSAEWVDGNLTKAELKFSCREFSPDNFPDSIDFISDMEWYYMHRDKTVTMKWDSKKCDVKVEHYDKSIEEYGLCKGLKEGLYQKFIKPEGSDWQDGPLYAKRKPTNSYWQKSNYRCVEEAEYKEGKLHGMSRKYDETKGWLKSETQYTDGKKHGFEKLYNSDGTVAEIKYWQDGVDCTAKYNRLKKIASKHIAEEDKISESKDKRVVLKRKSKLAKKVEFATEVVKDKLHLR